MNNLININNILHCLQDEEAEEQHNLETCRSLYYNFLNESTETCSSESPLIDDFINQAGEECIQTLTVFTLTEFEVLTKFQEFAFL